MKTNVYNYLVEQIPGFMCEESTKEHFMHVMGLSFIMLYGHIELDMVTSNH